MTRRFVAGLILETGVPGRTKCPVAPYSSMALSTVVLMLEELKMVLTWVSLHCFFKYNYLVQF